jgi:hypothetical protein
MKSLAVALAGLLLAAGCDGVTADRIEQWKNTEKGPGKLESALKDSAVPTELRARAAIALVDIGRPDPVDDAFAAMPAAERGALIAALIPLYVETLQGGTVTKARDARDGLFSLRASATPEQQARIDAALLPSVEKDLRAGRVAGGRHSVDKILVAIGPAAGPLLVKLLQDPAVPFPAVADVLAKVGDAAAREQGGAALVKRAGRGGEIPMPLWRALGMIGGKAVSVFLKSKIEKGGEQESLIAAQALQQGAADAEQVAFALRIAGNQRGNKAVRDEMFGVLEHSPTGEARDGAIRIIASDPEELVRYRAYEAALAIGKGDAIVAALEAFPAKASYKREDVIDFLVKDIQKIGATARPAILKALGSSAPLARMTGVLALGAIGTAADAPAAQRLAADRGTIKGFPPGSTIGGEASRVAAALLQKGPSGK